MEDGEISITRAETGGFCIYIGRPYSGNMLRFYRACSTADEAAGVIAEMLKEKDKRAAAQAQPKPLDLSNVRFAG